MGSTSGSTMKLISVSKVLRVNWTWKFVVLLAACTQTNVAGLSYDLITDWPLGVQGNGALPFFAGQVSGVALTADDREVVLFHRADRHWGDGTFDYMNRLRQSYRTPIPSNTLVWVDRKTGKVKKQGGGNLFYLPHGITIDKKGYIWITDVGSHQMYKLDPNLKVVLTLGQKFEPGSDDEHFCKPTDVAVQDNGHFFVGDGYCNSRVMHFNSEGKLVKKISLSESPNNRRLGTPSTMNIVHSVSLDQHNNVLYVADRENGRALVFDSVTGRYKKVIEVPNNGALYTLRYNEQHGGYVHIVTGPRGYVSEGVGYTYSVKDGAFVSTWSKPGGFNLAHAMAVSKDDKDLFVVEIGPNRAWKFSQRAEEQDENDGEAEDEDEDEFFEKLLSEIW